MIRCRCTFYISFCVLLSFKKCVLQLFHCRHQGEVLVFVRALVIQLKEIKCKRRVWHSSWCEKKSARCSLLRVIQILTGSLHYLSLIIHSLLPLSQGSQNWVINTCKYFNFHMHFCEEKSQCNNFNCFYIVLNIFCFG